MALLGVSSMHHVAAILYNGILRKALWISCFSNFMNPSGLGAILITNLTGFAESWNVGR